MTEVLCLLTAVTISVNPAEIKTEISPNIYGTGLEDVNHEIYGGLDAQRLYGESFEEPTRFTFAHGVSGAWIKSEEVDGGEFEVDRKIVHQGKQSQVLEVHGGIAAIANLGLNGWGVPVQAGKNMRGHLYVRGKVDSLEVGLEDRDGNKTYAIAKVPVESADEWRKAEFALKPNATDAKARFFIRASGEGKVWIDDVYLADAPTDEFGKIGCREDIVRAISEEGVNFLRWGGTMVNTKEYRLKNMRGQGERRPYEGWWFKYSSGGFGPYEFMRFAAAMKLPSAISISQDETIEDAVAFAEWTRQFDLPLCIEIGNEECISTFKENTREGYERYVKNVQRLVPPMRAANGKLTFASAAIWDDKHLDWMEIAFKGTDGFTEYWDIHLCNKSAEEARGNLDTLKGVMKFMRGINPGTKMTIAVFEENAMNHDLSRALATAVTAMAVREMGSEVYTCCGANALQAYLNNDNWWNQGQIYFTPDKVWFQTYAWAKQMGAKYHQPLLVAGKSDDKAVLVSPTMAKDGKTIVLNLVNDSAEAKPIRLKGLEGYALRKVTELAGPKQSADNPLSAPDRIRPVEATERFRTEGTIKPYSYTVIVLEK